MMSSWSMVVSPTTMHENLLNGGVWGVNQECSHISGTNTEDQQNHTSFVCLESNSSSHNSFLFQGFHLEAKQFVLKSSFLGV